VLKERDDLLSTLHLLPGAQIWTPYSSLVTTAAMSAVLGWRIANFSEELRQGIIKACADLGSTLAREHELALANSRLQQRRSWLRLQYCRAGMRTVRPSISCVSTIWQLSRLPSSAGSAVNCSMSFSPGLAGGMRERQGSST